MEEDIDAQALRIWADARSTKHALWLGAMLAVAATLALSALIDARSRASTTGGIVAFLLLLVTSFAVAFQRCPQCRMFWNTRGLFGFHTPYRSSCLHCELDAPSPSSSAKRPGRVAALFFAPALLSSGLLLGVHFLVPPPTVHRNVTLAALPRLRGEYVSLREGTPRTDLLGSYVDVRRGSTRGGGRRAIFQMAPLVPEGWTRDEPVLAWVSCAEGPTTGDCTHPARWLALLDREVRAGRPLRNAYVIPHANVMAAGWYKATRDAMEQHGITSDPDAVVLSWPEDPSRE